MPWRVTNLFNRAACSPQGPGPSATLTNGKSKGDQSKTVQGDQQTATKPHRNMHRKQHPRSENWPQEGRKWHQQWPKYGPKRCPRGFKNDPRTARRTQNRTKTIRAPPWLPKWGGYPQFTLTLWAPFWHPKTAPNGAQDDAKSKRKFKKRKEAIQDDQGPVLAPSWRILGSHVEAKTTQKYRKT